MIRVGSHTAVLRPIYTMRQVVCDSYSGVSNGVNACKHVRFHSWPATYEPEYYYLQSFSYVRMTIVYDKTRRVNQPLAVLGAFSTPLCIIH